MTEVTIDGCDRDAGTMDDAGRKLRQQLGAWHLARQVTAERHAVIRRAGLLTDQHHHVPRARQHRGAAHAGGTRADDNGAAHAASAGLRWRA